MLVAFFLIVAINETIHVNFSQRKSYKNLKQKLKIRNLTLLLKINVLLSSTSFPLNKCYMSGKQAFYTTILFDLLAKHVIRIVNLLPKLCCAVLCCYRSVHFSYTGQVKLSYEISTAPAACHKKITFDYLPAISL